MILHRIESDYCTALHQRMLENPDRWLPRHDYRDDCLITLGNLGMWTFCLFMAILGVMLLRALWGVRPWKEEW